MPHILLAVALPTLLALMALPACWQVRSESTASPTESVSGVQDTVPRDTAPAEIILQDSFTIAYVMGRFDPSSHPDFVLVDSQYADRKGMYLRRDTYAAFLRMREHAERDGIVLQIRSATRNFQYQKKIWEDKWTGTRLIESGENLAETTPDPKARALKILRYSSMPGSSRHHWGTDIDINNFENDWFTSGEGLKLYNWMKANAGTYGFCQPYTAGRPHGYLEERWHWSYMPVSAPLTAFAREHLRNEMIDGFLGSETAVSIDIVNKYVLGINPDCL
jgi:LAS superfamily LD-carboxypeptidase LdcB